MLGEQFTAPGLPHPCSLLGRGSTPFPQQSLQCPLSCLSFSLRAPLPLVLPGPLSTPVLQPPSPLPHEEINLPSFVCPASSL